MHDNLVSQSYILLEILVILQLELQVVPVKQMVQVSDVRLVSNKWQGFIEEARLAFGYWLLRLWGWSQGQPLPA